MLCSGVAYVMDEMLGNCTVMPIERDVFDDAMMKDMTHVRIRTAVEFFDLDNTQPVYMGQVCVCVWGGDVGVFDSGAVCFRPGAGRAVWRPQ